MRIKLVKSDDISYLHVIVFIHSRSDLALNKNLSRTTVFKNRLQNIAVERNNLLKLFVIDRNSITVYLSPIFTN